MRLRTIRYLQAFALFEQKKYEDSMDLFSSVSATPKSVVTLFPSVISGDLAANEDSDEHESKSTDQGEASSSPGTSSSIIAKAIPEALRASLDSQRRVKDTESDASSITSKHTETPSSGPPGITIPGAC